MPSRDEILWDWFNQRLQLRIPTTHICEHHQAPWEFFADAFYERQSQIIGLSCRTGGKTIGVAGLNVAEMAMKPRCGIVSIAGNFAQAKRGYAYVKDFIGRDKGLASKLAGQPLQTKTVFRNGANLEILTASERSVHSPHVPKLRIDEVDLVTADIYQGALSIPISYPTIRATVVLTSTRFKAYGMMYNLVEEAPERGAKVVSWCVREVAEPCPYATHECPMRKCEGFCDGIKCKKTQGFLKIQDLYDKYLSMDDETWRTQWLVEKPSRFGLVYDAFNEQHVVTDDMLPPFLRLDDLKDPHGNIHMDPRIRPTIRQQFDWTAGVDWGYEDPFVMLLAARLRNDDVYILDELYFKHGSPSEIAQMCSRKFPMLIARPQDHTWTEYEIAPVYTDPEDPASAREMSFHNFLVASRRFSNNFEGISLVRRFLRPPAEQRPKLYIHERCKQLRQEMNRYHLKEDSDIPMPGNDHGPDALRYLMTGTFMPEVATLNQTMMWTPKQVPIAPDLDIEIPGQLR